MFVFFWRGGAGTDQVSSPLRARIFKGGFGLGYILKDPRSPVTTPERFCCVKLAPGAQDAPPAARVLTILTLTYPCGSAVRVGLNQTDGFWGGRRGWNTWNTWIDIVTMIVE